MDNLGSALPLVVALWASVSALVAGYRAVNEKRDVIILGYIRLDPISGDPLPISMKHRKMMFQNDWIPLKFGLGLVSASFSLVVLALPGLVTQPIDLSTLQQACKLVAIFPGFSALGWWALGYRDFRFIKSVLDAEEKASKLTEGKEYDLTP
jgi:hypothetical protein